MKSASVSCGLRQSMLRLERGRPCVLKLADEIAVSVFSTKPLDGFNCLLLAWHEFHRHEQIPIPNSAFTNTVAMKKPMEKRKPPMTELK